MNRPLFYAVKNNGKRSKSTPTDPPLKLIADWFIVGVTSWASRVLLLLDLCDQSLKSKLLVDVFDQCETAKHG
jgi:hypothetical protein